MTPRQKQRLTRGLTLAGLVVVTYLLWDTFLTYPVKLLVVFVHESGHALAAILTGGEVTSIVVGDDLSGHVNIVGGMPFFILQAGYLAGAVFGAALIVAAADPRNARNTLRAVGAGVAACGLAFAWPRLFSFTFLFAIVVTVALVWVAAKGNETFVRWLLVYLATASAMYAVLDLKDDVLHLHPAGKPTDAVQLAERTGIPAILWGVTWAIAALAILGAALRKALR